MFAHVLWHYVLRVTILKANTNYLILTCYAVNLSMAKRGANRVKVYIFTSCFD